MFEFGIHGVEQTEPLTIIGRCFKGPMRVGGTFTSLQDERGAEHAVRLEVLRIENYGRDFLEIEDGLSARLTVRGDGGLLLSDRGVLRGA